MRDGWCATPLGALLTLVRRQPVLDAGASYKLLTIAINGKGNRLRKEVPGAELGTARFEAKSGDLMISKIDARKGACALLPDELDGAIVTGDFLTYEVNRAKVLPEFIDLWARRPEFTELCNTVSSGTTNRVRMDPARFTTLTIPVPPLPEQERIVDLIGAVDDSITGGEHELKVLLRLQREIPAFMHSCGQAEGWEASTLLHVLGAEDAVRTGPFGSQLHQSDYVPDGPVPVVMPANMSGGRVDMDGIALIRAEDAERLSRHLTRAGDILWSRRGDVARFAVIDEESEGSLCGTGCFLLRPKNPCETTWLEPWLSAPLVAQWLEANAVGATMKNLNRQILSGIPVRIPPHEKQETLSNAWSALHHTVRICGTHISNLGALRSNLLTALLSGEHVIPESYDELMGKVS